MRNYFERQMDMKIRRKLQQISREYEQAEKRLVDSIDCWTELPKRMPFADMDSLVEAGDELAESADEILKFYRWQPEKKEERSEC